MKVIECGENDLCNALYNCPTCDCESLEDWMAFCPSCGSEITEFAHRCNSSLENHEKDFYWVRCDLEINHDGNHEGIGMDEIKVEWDEDEKIISEEKPERG